VTGDWGGGAAPGPRVRQREVRARRRLLVAAIALVLVAVAIAGVVLTRESGENAGPPGPSASGAPQVTAEPFSQRLVLSVTGGASAMIAVIGSGGGREPSALVIPGGVTVVAPGQGEVTTEELAELPAPSMRVAVSNVLGAWVDRYAEMNLGGLSALTDSMGGLTVDLPDVFVVGNDVLGPGETRMSGQQVVGLLSAQVEDPALRWTVVLEGLLAAAPALEREQLVASDDVAGAAALLQAATGATVELAPVELVGGTVTVLQQPEFDTLTGHMFGIQPPVRVIVQNGNGIAGIGEGVAARLIPHGFRVVLSENASSFDVRFTEIIDEGGVHPEEAELARTALGVGIIEVSQVPSGFTDLTIVVGKDFVA
jgi:hypothetical protein